MLKVNPGETRHFPIALFADDAETIPLALEAPGVEIIASSWTITPATIDTVVLAGGTSTLKITLPVEEPVRKRHSVTLRFHLIDGQKKAEKIGVLVGWDAAT